MHLGKIAAAVSGVGMAWWIIGCFCDDVLHLPKATTFTIATGSVLFTSGCVGAICFGGRAGDRERHERAAQVERAL